MIEIRPITHPSIEDMQRLFYGYTSPARYRISKQETEEHTRVEISLENLPMPYNKTWPLTEEDIERYQRVALEGLSLGAYDGEWLAGMAIAGAERWNKTLWVWEFHIDPTVQGRGIGSRLMEALAEAGRLAGLRIMVCETQNTNVPAIRFYRRCGFEIGGIDLSYYSNQDVISGEVAIFMKRKL